MNKGLLLMLKMAAVASSVGHLMNPFAMGGKRYSGGGSGGRTPGMPHSKHFREERPHAPADGRWHMRFHRGRV